MAPQPVIGVISDHREGQGQRSFFFAGGAAVMAASLALLPAVGSVWRRFDPSTSDRCGVVAKFSRGTRRMVPMLVPGAGSRT